MPSINQIKIVDYVLGEDRSNVGQVRPAIVLKKLDMEGRVLLTVLAADEGDYKGNEWRGGVIPCIEADYDFGTEMSERKLFMPGTWHWPKADA